MANQITSRTRHEALRRLSNELAETGRDESPFRDSERFNMVYLRERNHLYPHITAIQVLANLDNNASHRFHTNNDVREPRKKLYNIEYRLQGDRRSAIMIICR